MRVLQLIDTLDAGGAERVAVTFANALSGYVEKSYLCATRKEGLLKDSIKAPVHYLFLKRKRTFDVFAIYRLFRFIQREQITIIHAHASSFFIATLIKILKPSLKLIWHDHYGNSEMVLQRKSKVLHWCSKGFSGIFSVNDTLVTWAKTHLKTKNIVFLQNVVDLPIGGEELKLKGEKGKRILCLANLRPQKDHENLLKSFEMVVKKHPDSSLHLVGKHWGDPYYKKVIASINTPPFEKKVYYYGPQKTTCQLLSQVSIGVLSSRSEGLPLALLEYGMAGLPVVSTDVGQCRNVIQSHGICVPPSDSKALAKAIIHYLDAPDRMKKDGNLFHNEVKKNHSISTIIPILISYYERWE